jgi:hypothetical protein
MPNNHQDDKDQAASTVRNPLPTAELGHVTLAPTEIVPVLGLSPIEALRRQIHRAGAADKPDATATNGGETRAKRHNEK